MLPGMALVPAIFEELLFRKAILNSSKRYGNCFAVVFSALLFGLYHMNLNQGIFAFLVGIIFGIIAVKTNSIKYTGILHFLNNLYACIFEIVGENSVAYGLFNNIVIAIVIIGIIVLIKNLPKLTKIKKEDFALNKDCKLLLRNYTFVIAMVLMIVMFVATENILVK
jgi:membrane protease YdiL (CAAX protease family)